MESFLFIIMKLFEELKLRGLVKQSTNEEKISSLLNDNKITFYIGFDPTADSLHVGHLMQLAMIKRLAQAGHKPIILLGGATALIGDPSGKSDMRKMLSEVDAHIFKEKISCQISSLISEKHEIRNNLSSFNGITFLSFIRDIGVHFSVNNMLRADCFKSRMEKGLTFLELNYMLMQAFDFYLLRKNDNCILQIGGDDQWSNILAGIDLVHKKDACEVFGMTLPLLISSTGQKMGKTEKGTIWLDSGKTSVFDFFQFWRNIPDSDVVNCINQLTFISLNDIQKMNIGPFAEIDALNNAKKILAFEMTKFVHGQEAATKVLSEAESLFEKKDASVSFPIEVENNINILDLLIKCNFATTKTNARNTILGKGIKINDEVITNPTLVINSNDEIIVKMGKKRFQKVVFKENI